MELLDTVGIPAPDGATAARSSRTDPPRSCSPGLRLEGAAPATSPTTPVLDELAEGALRLANYHTMPVCSPARAALLTCLNPHRVGYSTVANFDPGFPGYGMEVGEDVPTLAELLHDAGYATYAVGKWHLTRDSASNTTDDRRNWPLQKGFDQYYGVLEGLTSLCHSHQLVRDYSPLEIDELPDGYYYTDDITDQSISMVKSLRAHDPDKPFFLYVAHNAVHDPLQAKPADIARQRGRYDGGRRRRRGHAQLLQPLRPPARTGRLERGRRPGHRTHRRSAEPGALPARLGHGFPHPLPALQGPDLRGRRAGAVRHLLARGPAPDRRRFREATTATAGSWSPPPPRGTVRRRRWALYDLRTDPTETLDVARDHPEVVKEPVAAWESAAWRNGVFPLADGSGALARRNPAEERFHRPLTLLAGTPELERYRSSRLISFRSFEPAACAR
ncbi:sulfatase-like hydrolase/transferase [Streptomyces sp. NPDC058289]|uniref:sulfatase-like hydrolase/transferase n=1 Tax=Streptomyces sp. NPDC058289 TaxID=3346425 RepID=UPI0036EA3823